MDVLVALRALWRRRLLVGIGAVLAALLAYRVAGAATPGSGVATTSVLLDKSQSQIVDATPVGSTGLPWRATLLAELLGTDRATREIARGARIPDAQLAVANPGLEAPMVPASLPETAAQATAVPPDRYLLTVSADGVLPLVSVEAQAPDRKAAIHLADSAVRALRARAAPSNASGRQSFLIKRAAHVEARQEAGGAAWLKTFALTAVLFFLWCAGILAVRAAVAKSREETAAPSLGR
jgi:hypothetical protein